MGTSAPEAHFKSLIPRFRGQCLPRIKNPIVSMSTRCVRFRDLELQMAAFEIFVIHPKDRGHK